ncbi:MAG: von Willebrand factor type A domain-containing protein [Blastocatellia bacterium]|nr:von Willebrand factor type A domain-containing protein [Blastocatellia bacterium]
MSKIFFRVFLITLISSTLIISFPQLPTSQAVTQENQTQKEVFGSISGVITDEAGAVIPGATVTIRNIETGAEISVTTDENGEYIFPNLPIGIYEVKVTADGFNSTYRQNIALSKTLKTKLNLVLSVGSTADIVEVTGQTVTIERSTSQLSATYSARDVADLPINKQNTEGYKNYGVNPWTNSEKDRFSTFAIDVDTGSYTIARRKLNEGVLPPKDSVRVEEFINYFKYQYPNPVTKHPFSLTMEASTSPFDANRYLLRIGLKGREVTLADRPPTHLTFLVDNSGSMASDDKLGMVKQSLKMLVKHLKDHDTVAITTYAGGVNLVLSPTPISQKSVILSAIDELESGGGTAMEAGIDLAYKQAHASFAPNSINRIIICSDGDANIGKTSHQEILEQIQEYVKEGITVSTIGFGMGNYKDTMMEQFANKGNGNYYYIDNIAQAKRIFVEQLNGTLQVIAKDVKIQVEFNPKTVAKYRLVGYENRDIADADFRNDKVDAGEIGAGHTVTAIYEVQLKKQPSSNIATVRLRYKTPDAKEETPAEEVAATYDLARLKQNFDQTSEDFRFSIAVTALAEVLRESPEAKNWSLEKISSIAQSSTQKNNPEREEFLGLVKKALELSPKVASIPIKR